MGSIRMDIRSAADLAHDAKLGEVDPRTYPLLTCVRFVCTSIGSHERMQQANQLIYAIDKATTAEGDPRCRVHLTAKPGIDPKVAVEVHLQPLMLAQKDHAAFVDRVRNRLPDLAKAGQRAGWVLTD